MLIEIDYFRFALLQKHSKAKLKVRDKWLYWEYFANIEICPQIVFVLLISARLSQLKRVVCYVFFFTIDREAFIASRFLLGFAR